MPTDLSGPATFWAPFYLAMNADVRNSPAFGPKPSEALRHYEHWGVHEGRPPNPFFRPAFYIACYPDIAAHPHFGTPAGAWEHWRAFGIREGRRGSELFDPKWYMNRHGDLQGAFGANNWARTYQHWVEFGIKEQRLVAGDLAKPPLRIVNGHLRRTVMPTAVTLQQIGKAIETIGKVLTLIDAGERAKQGYDWAKKKWDGTDGPHVREGTEGSLLDGAVDYDGPTWSQNLA